jgi:hypothetical protein
MQKVLHKYRNQSRVFDLIEQLYSYVSDFDTPYNGILWLNHSFDKLCNILEEQLFQFQRPELKDSPKITEILGVRSDTNEVTVCLSGGKDSAAVAYYYKKRGYKVHLYHALGVNKAYGNERVAAKRIAEYLGYDLFIDKIGLEGSHNYIEHPMKNYIIADGAIHYCLAMGYAPTIAFGNFNQSHLADNVFEVCGGDCVEMWDAYKDIITPAIPNFKLELPLDTNGRTFELLSENWELFNLAISCMSPLRFREHWKHRTEEKYNIRLLDNRCGCCWKCCIEAMWLMDFGHMEFNVPYYVHCIEVLYKTVKKETGAWPESVREVWKNYMFYPYEQSKAKEVLDRATFHTGHAEYTE